MAQDWRPEGAEAVGTFLMVLLGGAAIVTGQPAALVAVAFGGAVMVLIYALGHVCGAHFNPAVTLGFAATGHFPWRRVPSYVGAQVLGAVAAGLALARLGPLEQVVARGSETGVALVLVELLATAMLAFVIIAVATDCRAAPGVAGLAIGATVFLGALVAGPLTGAAMNPARALGPAVVAGALEDLGLHVLGTVMGGVLGMVLYEVLRRGDKPGSEAVLGSAGPIELEAKA